MVEPAPAVEGAAPAAPTTRFRVGLGGLHLPGRSMSPVAAIVAAFLILTLVAMVSVLALGPGSPGGASGTPEQTLTSWAAAVEAGDYATADTYLSERLIGRGDTSRKLGNRLGLGLRLGTNDSGRTLEVRNVTIKGDRATALIAVKINSYGMEMSFPGTATLVKEDGAWKIDSVTITY